MQHFHKEVDLAQDLPARSARWRARALAVGIPVFLVTACDRRQAVTDINDPPAASCPGGVPLENAKVVSIGVGDTLSLSASEISCLKLTPGDGRPARYILAYVHVDLLEKAKTEWKLSFSDSFTIRVSDPDASRSQHEYPSSSLGTAPNTRPDILPVNRTDLTASFSDADSMMVNRAVPWKIGDEATFPASVFWEPPRMITARVIKLYGDGSFVVMVPPDKIPDYSSIEPHVDSAMNWLVRNMPPVYNSAIWPEQPRTSPLVPQLVIVISPGGFLTGGAGGLAGRWIEVYAPTGLRAYDVVSLFSHEMAHVWHMARKTARPVDSGSYSWNVEGIAEFFAAEALRRWYGYGFEDNLHHIEYWLRGGPYHWMYAQIDGRYFSSGYAGVAGFLRDVTWTLMREKGLSHDDALAAVASSVVTGWYGCTLGGCTAVGLADRMTQELGRSWDPADALLDWTLSVTVDDVVPSDRYRTPSFTDFSYLSKPKFVAFPPTMVFSPGIAERRATMPVGGSGFIDAYTDNSGALVSVQASAELRWRIMRVE